jgi:transposase
MGRIDLERLSKAELIELVLRLQQPAKTSRTSSKPPSTDRKAQRDKSRPGGAKPGHEGHSRSLSADFYRAVDHYPDQCPGCRLRDREAGCCQSNGNLSPPRRSSPKHN